MTNHSIVSVREIQTKDINLIADYWLGSDPEFLVSIGVDLNKLPTRVGLTQMLTQQLETPIDQKESYALIWECDAQQVGHSNVNRIEFGQQATIHLHLWHAQDRKKGMGTELFRSSLPFYFEKLHLQTLFCETYALNPAPNKTLQRVGFELEKKYKTIPGSLNFEQEVNRWKLTKGRYQETNNVITAPDVK